MKPDNWNSMTPAERSHFALELFKGKRGPLMIGRALRIASEALRAKKFPEPSDADDMEIIGTTLFETGWFLP